MDNEKSVIQDLKELMGYDRILMPYEIKVSDEVNNDTFAIIRFKCPICGYITKKYLDYDMLDTDEDYKALKDKIITKRLGRKAITQIASFKLSSELTVDHIDYDENNLHEIDKYFNSERYMVFMDIIDIKLIGDNSNIIGGYSCTIQDLADNSGGSGSSIDDTTISNDSTWSITKINSVLSDYDSTLRNGYNGTLKDLYDSIEELGINSGAGTDDISKYPPVDPNLSRCILTISNTGITNSNYGYTLKGLHNVLNSGDWSAYIKDCDYIKLITDDNYEINMVFNIDTYYDTNADGTTSKIAVHHIDMISKDLIPIPNSYWKMRTDNTNNGTTKQKNPYLASNKGECVKAKLAEYYTHNIPLTLKPYIIKKKLVVPYRYQSGSNLYEDNGKGLEELPKLWLPFKKEAGLGDAGSYETDMITYPIFIDDNSRIKKNASGSADSWWLASAYSVSSTTFYTVGTDGSAYIDNASRSYGVPLCFRFI